MDKSETFSVEIIRPTGVMYRGDALVVSFPAQDGARAVLAHHAPFLCALGIGILRIGKSDHTYDYFFVEGGTIEMTQNQLCLLAEKAVPASQIARADSEKLLRAAQDRPLSPDYPRTQKQKDIQALKLMLKTADKAKV
jgi:F-type H+-transporting ATPase subunit epsilon